jgi:hypothetical protein
MKTQIKAEPPGACYTVLQTGILLEQAAPQAVNGSCLAKTTALKEKLQEAGQRLPFGIWQLNADCLKAGCLLFSTIFAAGAGKTGQ